MFHLVKCRISFKVMSFLHITATWDVRMNGLKKKSEGSNGNCIKIIKYIISLEQKF